MILSKCIYKKLFYFLLVIFSITNSSPASGNTQVTDSAGNKHAFFKRPERVVSLLPYITEMLIELGQSDTIKGITEQDLDINAGLSVNNAGSYFSPDIKAVAGCNPDLIIAAPSHKEIISYFKDKPCNVVIFKVQKIDDAFTQMKILGRIFKCTDDAEKLIKSNVDKLALVKARVKNIPAEKRIRVARVMAGKEISCPGEDSYQTEMIIAAGGVPLSTGKNGPAVQVDLKQWLDFNPQFIYGCNDNKKAVTELINRNGWKNVDAVKNGSVAMFPCNLTCQVSAHTGDFIQWLATTIYMETFADPDKAVSEDIILEKTSLDLDIPYVKKAGIVRHRVSDAEYKSLIVSFKTPQDASSTFEGNMTGLLAAGNTYVPMHASLWQMAYGVDNAKTAIKKNLGYKDDEFTTLMTGADMDNLSISKKSYKDIEVTALVTAGVRGNALRASKDGGSYYGYGTINIIILTNHRLTQNAMLRAIITATEAKTAALLDMDIRSTYKPMDFRATGTGTDNILVIRGDGPTEKYTGGHTKTGELISKAVYDGVTEAIYKQNGIITRRSIRQRLGERDLKPDEIIGKFSSLKDTNTIASELDNLLAMPFYSSFIETAFTVSDEYEKGLISDLSPFEEMCAAVIRKISGSGNISIKDIPETGQMPAVLSKAFGSLLYGISLTENKGKQ